MWGKVVKIARKHTGKYFRTETGELGEAVHWHNWGGVDLLFQDGTIATCSAGDLTLVEVPDDTAQFSRFEFDETGRVKGGETWIK